MNTLVCTCATGSRREAETVSDAVALMGPEWVILTGLNP